MALGANLPIESIGELADRLMRERSAMEQQINTLRSAAQRDPSFTGNAADKYDQYLVEWGDAAAKLNTAIEGASNLLKAFKERLDELQETVAREFSM